MKNHPLAKMAVYDLYRKIPITFMAVLDISSETDYL